MHKYSNTSIKRLNTCHPDLQLIFHTVLPLIDHSIFCGHRDQLSQHYAFKTKKSKLDWPDSKHNRTPSMAVDAGPYFKELKNTDWDDYLAFALFAGHVMAVAKMLFIDGSISHQLIWGGDWNSNNRNNDQTFNDLPHFELTHNNVWHLSRQKEGLWSR